MQRLASVIAVYLRESILLIAVALAACGTGLDDPVSNLAEVSEQGVNGTAGAQKVFTSTIFVKAPITGFVSSCEEGVFIEGRLLIVGRTLINKNNFHSTFHLNLQNVRGIGETTGERYRAMNSIHLVESGTFHNGAYRNLHRETMRLVSGKRGQQLHVIFVLKTVTNASGKVTAEVERLSGICP